LLQGSNADFLAGDSIDPDNTVIGPAPVFLTRAIPPPSAQTYTFSTTASGSTAGGGTAANGSTGTAGTSASGGSAGSPAVPGWDVQSEYSLRLHNQFDRIQR